MKIKTIKKRDYQILQLEGSIRAGDEFQIAEKAETLFSTGSPVKFIIDLKNVPVVNSASLGIFLSIHKKVEDTNGRFSLCSLSRDVENLLDITKLTSILEIHKNRDEAIESYED